MNKTYRSSTILSISLNINGKKKRVSFDEAGSGSIYTTNSERIQDAMENHKYFNNGFFLDTTSEEVTEATVAPAEEAVKVVNVTSVAQARDYLVETYEIGRTQLRNKEQVLAAASNYGIKFEGLK